MKKTKKIIALMLAVIILISAFSINSFAVATPLEAGNSMETATEIPEYGVEYVSSLSTAGEVDWFKFTTLSEEAYYELEFVNYNIDISYGSNSYLPNISLCDSNQQVLGNFLNNGKANIKLERNTTYYIKILMNYRGYNSTGNYQVSVKCTFDNVANEKENAEYIEVNAPVISSFDGTGDIDWFCFTAPTAGEYTLCLKNYNLPSSGGTHYSPNIILFDEYYQVLGSSYNYYGNDALITITLNANEKYYINVHMGGGVNSSTGNYEVSVTCPEIVSFTGISLISLPSKTTYYVGDLFDATGLKVSANYSDGTSVDINDYTVTGFDSSSAGEKDIVVSYTKNGVTHTCSFKINVVERVVKTLSGIYVYSKPYKTTYKIGESFNSAGLSVKAQYSDGTIKTITGYNISGFDSAYAGSKTITVSYTENGVTKTCTFNVEVVAPEKELTSISVHTMPDKTVYQVGEAFDETGIAVYAYYSDGTYSEVDGYYFRNFDSSVAGTNTVTVIYSEKGIEKSAEFDVTIEEAQSESFFTMIINAIINFFLSIFSIFSF